MAAQIATNAAALPADNEKKREHEKQGRAKEKKLVKGQSQINK